MPVILNSAPTSTYNPTLSTDDVSPLIFTASNFSTGYFDSNNDAFSGIKITQLESSGSLEFWNGSAWTAVTLNQIITKTALDAGSLRFVPDEGGADATFKFAVRDARGAFDATPNTVTIDVTVSNTAPVVSGPVTLAPILEDSGQITITKAQLIANATDADDDALSVTNLTASAGTLTTVVAGSTWTLTPAANYNGTITLSYNVSDGRASVATTATQIVTPVNDAPTAANMSVSTNEDVALALYGANYLPSAADVDGDTVTYALVDDAFNGHVTILSADGNYSYTPDENFNGEDSFTYSVSDGHGGTNTYTVDVTVNPVNDAAVISGVVSGNVTEESDLQETGTMGIYEVDAGENVFTAQTNTATTYGHFSINTLGEWTYTLDNDLEAVQALNEGETLTDILTLSSVDGTEQTIEITINGTNEFNHQPVLVENTQSLTSINEDSNGLPGTTIADLIAANSITDVDGAVDAIAITGGGVSTGPSQLTFNTVVNGSVDAAEDAMGNVASVYVENGSVIYRGFTAGDGWSTPITLGSGSAPVVSMNGGVINVAFIAADGTVAFTSSTNGTDWSVLENPISAMTSVATVSIDTDAAGVAYVAAGGQTDGDGYRELVMVSNELGGFAQEWTADGWYWYENGGRTGRYYEDPVVSVDDAGNWSMMFKHQAVDGAMGWNENHSYLVFNAENEASSSIEIGGAGYSYAQGLQTTGAGTALMAYALGGNIYVAALSNGVWDASTALGSGSNPSLSIDSAGNTTIAYNCSLTGALAYQTVLTGLDATDAANWSAAAPVITDAASPVDPIVLANAGQVIYTANDGDTEIYVTYQGDAPSTGVWQYSTDGGETWNSVGEVSDTNALLLGASDLVRFIPAENFNGTASFDFKAWDQFTGTAGSYADTTVDPVGDDEPAFSADTGTATITVTAVNDAPCFISLSANTVAEVSAPGTVVGSFSATDIEGDEITYSLTDDAGGAFSIINGNQLAYDGSSLDYDTQDSVVITVQATDENGASSTQEVTILLTNVNDNTPVLADSTASVDENSANATAVVTLAATDADGALNALTYSATGNGTGAGLFSIAANGAITVTGALDYEAAHSYTFEVQVSDTLHTDTAMITINVNNTNDNAPTFTSTDTATIAENTTAVKTVTSTDLDGALNTITYSIEGGADSDLFTIDPTTGALSFIAAPNYEAPSDAGEDNVYDVTVGVSDTLHTVTQDIAVTVTNANDAAVIVNDLLDPALEFSTTTFTLGDLSATDEDGDALTFTLTSLPELGQLYLNDTLMEIGDTFTSDDIDNGALKYANDGRGTTDLEGHDSFGITVGDGESTTAGTVDINVYRDNTAPILDLNGLVLGGINGNAVEYTEEASAVVLAPVVSFTDTDTPDLTGGHLLVDVMVGAESADVLSVLDGGSNGRITVDGNAVSFDGSLIGHVDSENDGTGGAALQINFDANPVSVIAVRHLTQSVTFASDSVGTHSDVVKTIQFNVNDGEGVVDKTSADATVTLTAHPHNDAPVAYEYSLSNMYENASTGNMVTTIVMNATDEEGDEITVTAIDDTETVGIVTFDEMGQTLYYQSENMEQLGEDEIGTDSFTYTISDGVNEDTATINWTITGVNDAPVAVDDVNTISADATEAISGNVIVSNASIPTLPMNTFYDGNLEIEEGSADYTDIFKVDLTADTLYTITVLGADTDIGTMNDTVVVLYDANGVMVDYNDDGINDVDSLLEFMPTTTGMYYIAVKEYGNDIDVTYRVSITDGGEMNEVLGLAEESGIAENGWVDFWDNDGDNPYLSFGSIQDSDVDNDAVLSVEGVSSTTSTPQGEITGNVSETSDTDYWDGIFQTVSVGDEVSGIENTPESSNGDGYIISLEADTTYILTTSAIGNMPFMLYSDTEGSTVSYIEGTGTVSFTTTAAGNYYLQPYNLTGDYTFSIVAAASQVTTNHTLGQEFDGIYGTFLVNADGTYTYTVDTENADLIALGEGESLDDTITYTLTDEYGATDTATLTVTVNGVNDAPVIVAAGEGFSESNVPFAFDGLGGNPGPITVSDAEDDILTVTLTASAGTGTLDINEVLAENTLMEFSGDVSSEVTLVGTADNINAVLADLTFISNNGWYGTGSVTVEATDGLDEAVSQSINYEIVPTSEEYYFDAIADELMLEDGNGGEILGENVIYNFTLGDGVEESDYDSLTISGASAADADIVIGDLDGNPGNGDNLLINFADASVALVGVADDVNFDSGRITFQDGSFLKLNTSGEKALIIGGAAADQLIAGNMGDTLRGLGGDDKLIGGEGNDWIYGGSGNDIIEAGAGNNIINGGVGDDEMTAGEGQDWFSYSGKLGGVNSGFDAIFNFDIAMDKIQLTGFKTISPSLMDTIVFTDDVGDGSGNAQLILADNSIITLVGVDVADLSINNFAGYSDTFTNNLIG